MSDFFLADKLYPMNWNMTVIYFYIIGEKSNSMKLN